MEITRRVDLEVGDVATFAYYGHEFTGVVWSQGGRAMIGKMPLGGTEEWDPNLVFVRATREMPPLPTEPGAVILVTECQGERVDEPVLAVLASTGRWWTHGQKFNDYSGHYPEQVTEWTPAKVVPA